MAKYKNFLGLGIAGNFALHLAQAGELEEFKNIITQDEAAPKGMFPFYLPKEALDGTPLNAKEILHTYPLSSSIISLPDSTSTVQAEPEVALVCNLEYCGEKLSKIVPTYFGAYNDCSIRVGGANKISDKKNWGEQSKGLSNTLIKIDKFSKGGVIDNYSICSYLRRDNKVHAYGEDVELTGYSYFHEKLLDWMTNQINTQEDFGPLEPIEEYIIACGNPKEAIISIGATRYTKYGETTFLKSKDEIIIIVYDSTKNSSADILKCVKENSYDSTAMSVLAQTVL